MTKMRGSQRRFRSYVVVVLVLFAIYYLTPSHSDPQDFYRKTMQAMGSRNGGSGSTRASSVVSAAAGAGAGAGAAAGPQQPPIPDALDHKETTNEADAKAVKEMSNRVKDAAARAKDAANKKSPLKPDLPSEVVGVGSSAGGQNGKDKEKDDATHKVDKDAIASGSELQDQKELSGSGKTGSKTATKSQKDEAEETPLQHEAELELTSILKRAPMIIFSKSYCPYSKRAKKLLLETYSLDPEPYVVELDDHPLGQEIQALLTEKTGRSTVPNIMVNGISIGGSDDVVALDTAGKLVSKVLELGEARKLSMVLTADKAKTAKTNKAQVNKAKAVKRSILVKRF
ncbi:hypothetical protein BROUX41_000868 [Berkeleyomyces rouxiae]|uniref:uncharacterized protein n=1 Tax=Berkeleyomyces rouxiae TaxID=2035830 RepID=UPI003B7AC4B5